MSKMLIGGKVVVRTYSAGVHVGTLVEHNGREVVLTEARRIWSWAGANTLHEVAVTGIGAGSRVSVPVSQLILTEAIEIIEMTAEAATSIESVGWTK